MADENCTAKAKMEQVQKALDDYEKQLKLPQNSNLGEDEINSYFNMARNDIEQLSPLSCNEISARLTQYAFYIQKEHNREQSRITWADTETTKYVSDKIDQVGGQYTKYNNKVWMLAKQDEYLTKILAIRDYAQQRVDRLTYLATSINRLSDVFQMTAKTKLALRERTA